MPWNGQGYVVLSQAAADANLGAQTITVGSALLTGAADGATTQTAVDNLIADLNDLKAKFRTARLLAT